MALRIITWLVSLGVHAGFALFMLMPASGGVALEEGVGDDIMVVEQGIAIQGFAKLGEDVISVEAVEAPPVQMAAAQPLPERMKPIEELPVEEEIPEQVKPIEQSVIASDAGPEQINVKEPDPEDMEEPDLEEMREPEPTPKEVTEQTPKEVEKREPLPQEVKELEPDEVEQLKPQQVATVPMETVIAMRESSGEEKKGGSATEHRKYLGKLRTHLERNKVNPRTTLIGTTIVRLTVKSDGQLVSRQIVKSSGLKVLDDAALASIEKASPFPAIPDEVGEETIEVSVPFKFSVR